jgi:hypothetical protein
MALLGEMHFVPLGPGAWLNLPRDGGVAYCAQEAWIQNETIRVGFVKLSFHVGPFSSPLGQHSVWLTLQPRSL